jgi:hypothetical protein
LSQSTDRIETGQENSGAIGLRDVAESALLAGRRAGFALRSHILSTDGFI